MVNRVNGRNRQNRRTGAAGAAGADAYMTVEAALILPMALCLIVICLYAAFLLYDRCLFSQDAYLLCMRESYEKGEGAPAVDVQRVNESAQEQLGSKYYAVDALDASAAADDDRTVYAGTAAVYPAVFGEYFLMPDGMWEINFSAWSEKTDPAWAIRSWRRRSYVIVAGLSGLVSETSTSSGE